MCPVCKNELEIASPMQWSDIIQHMNNSGFLAIGFWWFYVIFG
jgi:hypothetical protein